MASTLTTVINELVDLILSSTGPVKAFVDEFGLTAWPDGLSIRRPTDKPTPEDDQAAPDIRIELRHAGSRMAEGGIVGGTLWRPMRILVVGSISPSLDDFSDDLLHQYAEAVARAIRSFESGPSPTIKAIPSMELNTGTQGKEDDWPEFQLLLEITFEQNT